MALITILTLALVLLPATQIVRAEALLTAAVYFTCATIFGSMAINLVGSDEQVKQSIADWFYGCCDDVKNAIYNQASKLNIINGVLQISGTDLKISFSADDWSKITQEVLKYYKTYYDSDGTTITAGSNGHIGFTNDSAFTIHLTNDSLDLHYIQTAFLNDMTITFYDEEVSGTLFERWPVLPDEDTCNHFGGDNSYIINVNYLSLMYYSIGTNNWRGDYVANSCESADGNISGVITFDYANNTRIWGSGTSIFGFINKNNWYEKWQNMYSINGQACHLHKCSDGKYRFVTHDTFCDSDNGNNESTYEYLTITNSKTNVTYNEFNSYADFISVVCEASGLDFPATNDRESIDDGVYNTPVIPSFGSVPDVYNGTDSVTINVSNANDITDVNDISKVLDSDITLSTDTVADYPDGVPEIDSSGLFDKFPFCIPYDIYNLFVGFSAEAAPPKFDIPFKIWKNADGSYLIDETITIDFSQFSQLAYLCRWFIAIEFTFGLVLITRKVIGNN